MSGPSNKTRSDIAARSKGRCERCGRSGNGGQVHHRKPRRMGGRKKNSDINMHANLMLLCSDCHATVESRREQAMAEGFVLSEMEDPAVAPVFVMQRRWVLLGEGYLPYEMPRTAV